MSGVCFFFLIYYLAISNSLGTAGLNNQYRCYIFYISFIVSMYYSSTILQIEFLCINLEFYIGVVLKLDLLYGRPCKVLLYYYL